MLVASGKRVNPAQNAVAFSLCSLSLEDIPSSIFDANEMSRDVKPTVLFILMSPLSNMRRGSVISIIDRMKAVRFRMLQRISVCSYKSKS